MGKLSERERDKLVVASGALEAVALYFGIAVFFSGPIDGVMTLIRAGACALFLYLAIDVFFIALWSRRDDDG